MNPICRVVGHKPPRYGNDAAYGRLILGGVDGIGRCHAHVEAECDRCGERFVVIRVHMPETDSKNEDTISA